MIVRHINVNYCAQVWSGVEDYIKDALSYGGDDYTLEQVKAFVCSGYWLLLVAISEDGSFQGAMTVSFINYPNDRVAFVTSTGGKFIINKDTLEQLKVIVKQMGATKIQAAGRPSMVKLLTRTGFYERYTTVETKI